MKKLFPISTPTDYLIDMQSGELIVYPGYRTTDFIALGKHRKILMEHGKIIAFYNRSKVFMMWSNNPGMIGAPRDAMFMRCTYSVKDIMLFQVKAV